MAYNILISDIEIDVLLMPKCKQNHNLEKWEKGKQGLNWNCDGCSKSAGGMTNKYRFTCRKCDYDQCDQCIVNLLQHDISLALVNKYQPAIDE